MYMDDSFATDTAARVLRQLCEALLCEGWASALEISRDAGLAWRFGSSRFRACGRRGAFGRYRLQEASIAIMVGRSWRPAQIDDLLSAISTHCEALDVLRADLAHTEHLGDLNARALAPLPRRHSLTVDELEAALHEGHPYHPCFKARSGFSDADHRSYGPEFAETFRLIGVLFHPDLVQQSLPHAEFWEQELGADEWARLRARARQDGAPIGQYQLLPLHPWQAVKLRQHPLYQSWLDQRQAVEFGPMGAPYRASQSVRTLMNAADPTAAHVKTALAMRNTSSLRTIEPSSVAVAPAISRWLADVVASDPLLQDRYRLTLLAEYAGINVGRGTALDGHLAAIWRQSPASLGVPVDQMMPFNGLALQEPDGQPLIATWIAAHGLDAWLDQLIEVAVLPVWHLMVAHGIALEAHGQNLILQHENGWPTGLIARDFHESLEYVAELLSRPDLCPDLAQIDPAYRDAPLDLYHQMAEPEELRALVMDTLFVFNLADLSDLLQRHYDLPERTFWQKLRQRLDRYAAEHGLEARQAQYAPFAPQIVAESLITRKVDPHRPQYRHLIANSLAGAVAPNEET